MEQGSEYMKLLQDFQIRPISVDAACLTHPLSNFIDLFLKPLCSHMPSFPRDGIGFLSHLPETTESNSLLVLM